MMTFNLLDERRIRWIEALLWLALCALAGYWIALFAGGKPLPIPAPVHVESSTDSADPLVSARLFGAQASGADDDVRLIGIIADAAGAGSAILSVNGASARAYRSGARVGNAVLGAVRRNEVDLDRDGATRVLKLAKPG